jgi:DNA replication protein DnaC
MRHDETKDQCAERRRMEDAQPTMVEIFQAKKSAAVELALAQIGVPERALEVARKCSPTPAVRAVEEVGSRGMMILSGGVGCGKTVGAAKWIYDYVTSKEVWKSKRLCNIDDETMGYEFQFLGNAVWVTSAKLARVDHYDASALAQYTQCNRLVIDDLGIEFMDGKGFYLSLFNELIDERYASERATVMTTNCSADEFKARYKDRVVDRVRESGRFFGCGEESLRKKPVVAQMDLGVST